MRKPKIVVIGAGSVIFGPGIVRDVLVHPSLQGSEIVVVDIDAEQLDLVLQLSRRLNQLAGSGCTITATADRREALVGADYVVISVAVERERLWKLDFQIPLKHGIKHVLGENGGPGGLSHSLRNIPLLLPICRDIEELAPDAWVINFTNPMSRLCMALAWHTELNFVGLCHQIGAGYRIVSSILGIPADRFRLKACGLNHFTWIQDLRSLDTGDDLYPLFWDKLEHSDPSYEPLSRELAQVYGLYPAVGDTHAGEYIADAWRHVGTQGYDFDAYGKRIEARRENIRSVISGDDALATEWLATTSGERAIPVIVGLHEDTGHYEEALNVINMGATPNLPSDAIVEGPAVVSAMGIQPIQMPPLPDAIAALCNRQIAIQELVVEAGVNGDREAALQAMALDPLVPDMHTARVLLDELLAVHAPYLPQFES